MTPPTIEEQLDGELDEILDTLLLDGTYHITLDGDFVPVNWEGSPLLAEAKQKLKSYIATSKADTLRSIELPEEKTDKPEGYPDQWYRGFNAATDLAHQAIEKKIAEVSE